MFRLSRSVFLTAVLTASAVVLATLPAGAQTREGLLLAGTTSVSDAGNSAFLTAGMVEQAPPPPGGSGPRASGFGIGAKIGPLWSSFDSATVGSTTVNFDTSTGWEGGIWFGGNRGGRIGVMGEILYAKKKQQVAGQTGSTSLKYLEIPILMRVNIGSRSRNGISVYGLVGPVFDVNLKAEANGIDVKKGYESLDLGILGGVGIEITRFLVEGRFNKGLRNTLKSDNLTTFGDIKTRSFAVLFGIRFN
jgi:outer membrane protein with beta-barrel domain